MHVLDEQVAKASEWFDRPRFAGIQRRSQSGPSSNFAITSVIILFLGVTTPILRTRSV